MSKASSAAADAKPPIELPGELWGKIADMGAQKAIIMSGEKCSICGQRSPHGLEKLSISLTITMTEGTPVKLESVAITGPGVFEGDDLRDLTTEELGHVFFPTKTLVVGNVYDPDPALFDAPNGKYFTIQDTLDALCKYEAKIRRLILELGGGVDLDHIYFEGSMSYAKGVGRLIVHWGS